MKILALLFLALAAALIYASKFRIQQRQAADEIPMDMAKLDRALANISERYRVR